MCFIVNTARFLIIIESDKHGQLGIWDARAQGDEVDEDGDISLVENEGGKYWRLQLHWPASSKSSISSIKLDPTNSHSVRSILFKEMAGFTFLSRFTQVPTTALFDTCHLRQVFRRRSSRQAMANLYAASI